MTPADESTNRAIARLLQTPDFKTFLQWLEDERTGALEELMSNKDSVLVHQMQGSTRILTDIQRAVMSAPQALANLRGQT